MTVDGEQAFAGILWAGEVKEVAAGRDRPCRVVAEACPSWEEVVEEEDHKHRLVAPASEAVEVAVVVYHQRREERATRTDWDPPQSSLIVLPATVTSIGACLLQSYFSNKKPNEEMSRSVPVNLKQLRRQSAHQSQE